MSRGHLSETTALVIGGGFAGVACAKALAKHDVRVTLVDRHNYTQFQPMLYQIATGQVATLAVARPLRGVLRKARSVDVKMAEVIELDPRAKLATCADGTTYSADYVVLAMGSAPNFFETPGAEDGSFPLYALEDAERLRSRILAVLEDADRNPKLLDQGALNFVIVGAGATGVETAGALADVINTIAPAAYPDLAMDPARVYVVDPADVVLAPFSEKAHEYARTALEKKGVQLVLGAKVTEIRADRVILSDGGEILTRTVVWAGGIQGAELAAHSGITQGRGGRIDVNTDLTVEGFPGVYALGDVANTPSPDGKTFPQLGSVALQAGRWAGKNIVSDIEGKPRTPFQYRDKGIMAMIGKNAAIAEIGGKRRELHGPLAFVSWLGVHAALLTGFRERSEAIRSWIWDYFTKARASSILDRPDAARIDWDGGAN